MFSCTPSQLNKEDADIIRLVSIYHRGNPPQEGGNGYGE